MRYRLVKWPSGHGPRMLPDDGVEVKGFVVEDNALDAHSPPVGYRIQHLHGELVIDSGDGVLYRESVPVTVSSPSTENPSALIDESVLSGQVVAQRDVPIQRLAELRTDVRRSIAQLRNLE
jgi:hypothetical protein